MLFATIFIPDLWVFGLILVGVGLWQTIKLNVWLQTRWQLLAGWSLFILVILISQVIMSFKHMGQTEDYYLGPEITGDMFLGQTFQADCNGLNRIRLTLGIYNKTHNQPITFHLYSQTTGEQIFVEQFTTEHLTDRTAKDFIFPPQPNSSQQTYLA